jgi:hypothetical protein
MNLLLSISKLGGECSASRHGRFIPVLSFPSTHIDRRLGGH